MAEYYKSAYTGAQIDEAVGVVLDNDILSLIAATKAAASKTEIANALSLIRSILYKAVYTGDVSGLLSELDALMENFGTAVTLTGISVVYTGGSVPVGTAVTSLSGIVVTAAYSDGSSAVVNNYAISGTINEGSNTVTVSYGGKTVTFTVVGYTEESGGDTEVTLVSISAIYSGGDVPVGTGLADLLLSIAVTASYSDGSIGFVSGYDLSGNDPINEGENIITVSYGGASDTFAVVGYAEDSGDDSGGDDSGSIVSSDGNLTVSGVSAADDGEGNITVSGMTASGDDSGNITAS